MVDIIDLGWINEIDFSKIGTITVIMTLTSKGCPIGQAIGDGVKNAIGEKLSDREIEVILFGILNEHLRRSLKPGEEQLGF